MESERASSEYYEFDEDEIPLDRFHVSKDATPVTIEQLGKTQRRLGVLPELEQDEKPKKGKKEKASEASPPKPFASSRRKIDIFKADDFKTLDKSVLGLLPTKNQSWQDFAEVLTKNCWTSLDKVRAIYYWLGNLPYEAVENNTDEAETDSPLDVVKRAKKERIFSAIFHRLIMCANVHVQLVKGVKRGTNYKVGYKLTEAKDSGMWFAVFVANEWRFVDAHWGCGCSVGYVDGSWDRIDDAGNVEKLEDSEGQMMYSFNEFYFLTDPEEMIFKHFPNDPEWQLLAQPISLATFEELPFLLANKMAELNLQIVTHSKGVLQVPESGEVELAFQESAEKNKYGALLFLHKKSNKERADKITINGKPIDLTRFLMVHRTGSKISVRVQPPRPGKYLLILQGSKDEGSKDDLVHYVLHCPQIKAEVVPMPEQVVDSEWGMGARADTLGVERISEQDGEAVTVECAEVMLEDGEGNLILRSKQNLEYQCELNGDEIQNSKNKANVVHWKGDTGEQVIHIMAPDEGLYGLSVKAKKKEGADDFKQVGTFVVEADTNAEEVHHCVPTASLQDGHLGFLDTEIAADLGAEPLSHKDPLIKCYDPTLAITWTVGEGTVLSGELCTSTAAKPESLKADTSKRGEVTFDITFPEIGNYTLKILAMSADEKEPQPLYMYLIRAIGRPADDQKPFPKTNPAIWAKGYELVTPDTDLLPPQTEIEIVIKAPKGIRGIALLDNKKKVHLFGKRDEHTWDLYFNTGFAGSNGGKLPVLVDQGLTKKTDYEDLLEFKIMSGEELMKLELQNARNEENFMEKEKREKERQKKKRNHERKKKGEAPESDSEECSDNEVVEPKSPRERPKTGKAKQDKVREDNKTAREQLEKALRQENKQRIEKSLQKFQERNIVDKDGVCDFAKDVIEMLDLRKNLEDAMLKAKADRKKAPIARAIKKIDRAKVSPEMFERLLPTITEAQDLFKKIDRTERLFVRVLELDGKTLLELRNYAHPSADVHSTIQGTLLLLGYYEKRTKKWHRCQPLLKGIIGDIKNYNHLGAHPALAARAMQILAGVDEHEIALKSGAAAAFFYWSTGIIELIQEDSKAEDFKPANLKLQRKILHISKIEHADLDWEDSGQKKKQKAYLSDAR